MKHILIIADGKSANRFLHRLNITDAKDHRYHVVYFNDKTIIKDRVSKFNYYKFDPTSYIKLKTLLLSEDFFQCMIINSNKIDSYETYRNIRQVRKNLQIVMLDRWNFEVEDPYLTIVDALDTLSNIFINYLPDFPLFAQNLGLGIGEIMEFSIPYSSPYIFRHISKINQKKWKIAAIFRDHKVLLPDATTVLLPNDSILAVGDPNVLKGVYRSVKREFGQFPIPFGENIYTYIDMKHMSENEIKLLINDSMILHSKINSKKLIFKIVNVTLNDLLEKIKSYDSSNMIVEMEYHKSDFQEIIKDDIAKYSIGLFVVDNNLLNKNIELLFSLNLPIFKISKYGFFTIKESVLLCNDSKLAQSLSAIIFDVSSQLDSKILLFEQSLDKSSEQDEIIEHFQNISKLFERKIEVVKTDKNPLVLLKGKRDFIQFIIYDKSLISSKFSLLFSTDYDKHYQRFKDNYQLFIPSQL